MRDEYYADKVAVVTGAGGTLCSVVAKDLADKGAKVVLIGRTREKLEKVAAEKDVSFSHLVIQCCEYALKNIENDKK